MALGVTAVLEDMGHQATRALDGAQACRLLNTGEAFDLVITDYAMPGMTGLELAHAIKASWPDLPVVLATGYAELPTGSAPDQHGSPVQAVPAGRSGRTHGRNPGTDLTGGLRWGRSGAPVDCQWASSTGTFAMDRIWLVAPPKIICRSLLWV